MGPKTIIYVSCEPATLARDMQILAKKHYKAEIVQPVDMFPQTGHIECVVKITKQTKIVKETKEEPGK